MNNQEIEQLLKNSIKHDKILHSYMFVGSKLTHKEKASIEFAKEVLCLDEKNTPCEKCKSCLEMDNKNHPDFREIKLEDNENAIKIEQIRKMQEDVIKKPIISDRKIYIIKNSDKMTVRSAKLLAKNIRRTAKIHNHNFISRQRKLYTKHNKI